MSPTYWAASQIKMAARAHGWEFVPCVDGKGPWGCRKEIWHISPAGRRYDYVESLRVMFGEDRRGGLTWVRTTRTVGAGTDVTYYGRNHRDKLKVVLDFLRRRN